jgi:hypothetical protein
MGKLLLLRDRADRTAAARDFGAVGRCRGRRLNIRPDTVNSWLIGRRAVPANVERWLYQVRAGSGQPLPCQMAGALMEAADPSPRHHGSGLRFFWRTLAIGQQRKLLSIDPLRA